MTRPRTRGRACPNFRGRVATSVWRSPTDGWWWSEECLRGQVLKSVVALDLDDAIVEWICRTWPLRATAWRWPPSGRPSTRSAGRTAWRRPSHVVGGSAEAGTAQTAARTRMAVATGCADGEVDDGVDGARRRDLGRRRYAPRRDTPSGGELQRTTGQWQAQPPLPIPLHHATAATYRGEMVVIGGASDNLADASNKVFAFRDGKWDGASDASNMPGLRRRRRSSATSSWSSADRTTRSSSPQTEVFDGKSWTQAADLPTPREHLAAVSDGVYVYTVGGRNLSADENSAAFERFDPESGNWEKLANMPTPRGSYGAAFIDGRIVVVGGEEPTRCWRRSRCTTSPLENGPRWRRSTLRCTARW